jgi:hypothetical protein
MSFVVDRTRDSVASLGPGPVFDPYRAAKGTARSRMMETVHSCEVRGTSTAT